MSFCDYLMHGTGGAQAEHLKSKFFEEQYAVVAQKGSFNGQTVTDEANDSFKTTTIDGVIQVRTVADSIRNDEKGFWNKQKTNCKILFSVTFATGLAGLVGSIVAAVLFSPLLTVAIVVGAISLAVLGGSFFTLYRTIEAKGEEKQWSDPVAKLVKYREQAGLKGFNYAFDKQLKDRAVTGNELQEMWYVKMQSAQDAFTSGVDGIESVSATKIRQFFSEGVLGTEKLTYAFGDSIPEDLQSLSKIYEALTEDFKTLGSVIKKRRREIEGKKREKLLEPV